MINAEDHVQITDHLVGLLTSIRPSSTCKSMATMMTMMTTTMKMMMMKTKMMIVMKVTLMVKMIMMMKTKMMKMKTMMMKKMLNQYQLGNVPLVVVHI